MTSKCLASLAAAAVLCVAQSASAQAAGDGTASGPMTSDEAVGHTSTTTPEPTDTHGTGDRSTELLNYHGIEYSVGWRAWGMAIPQAIVGLFVHVESGTAAHGWGGSLGLATGPEFVYRNNGTELIISAMYVDYSASGAYFRANSDPDTSTELVTSYLYGLYLTFTLMKSFHLHPMFEIQVGAALGLGYIGGDLYRSQAYPTDNANPHTEWADCVQPNGPMGTAVQQTYCDPTQSNHFTANHYTEPSFFNGGSVPTIIPWISLPQVSFHFRPVKNFDLRADVGFAGIGFFFGGAAHFVF